MSFSNLTSLYFEPTCKHGIELFVKCFKNKTVSENDEISNKLLKVIINDIPTHIEVMFNKFLNVRYLVALKDNNRANSQR